MRDLRPALQAAAAADGAVARRPKRHRLYVSSVVGGAGAVATTRLGSPSPAPTSGGGGGHCGPVSPAAATRSWRVLTQRHQTQLRITKALLVVSTVFVALNLPSYAFRIHAFIIALRDEPYELSLIVRYSTAAVSS